MFRLAPVLLLISLASTCVFGQSLNIAIGPPGAAPTSAYAGAGAPGYWNSVTAAHGSFTFGLRDLNNVATGVRLYQYGGTELRSSDDPATSGGDAALMDHCLVTYTPSLETCAFLDFMQPGQYEVTIYGWMPNRPDVRSYTSSDEEPGYPHRTVGGPWPGAHEEYVTFSRHLCNVGGNGRLRMHSGIVPGDNPSNGAAMNGLQVRLLPSIHPADLNCDGSVNNFDIDAFVLAIADSDAYRAAFPFCRIDNADINVDGQVNNFDIDAFVACVVGGGCP